MQIRTGIDIVYIPEFDRLVRLSKKKFMSKCFSEEETKSNNLKSLAGVFAAKESIIKALNLKPGSWLDIALDKSPDGKPFVTISNIKLKIVSSDISISHDGEYAIAQYTALVK